MTAPPSCRSRQPPPSAATAEDSVRLILAAYEHDRIPLDFAAQRVADVLEPTAGWTLYIRDSTLTDSGPIGTKGREALNAAVRELARRPAGKH